jgi:MoaA/NifB/PqqE/SkfB family radical SAM enzyme
LDDLFETLARGGTRGVTVEGGGEPTLSPLFETALELAAKHKLSLGLITNGTRLFAGRSPELYRAFQWIRVSLDAADPSSYLKLKGKDLYGRVLENVGVLCGLGKAASGRAGPGPNAANAPSAPLVGVGHVLTRENDDDRALAKLAEGLKKAGAGYLHLRPAVDHPELASPKISFPELAAVEDARFRVNLAALRENAPSGNLGLPCLAHSLTTVIGADGLVRVCGRLDSVPGLKPLGDLKKESFREIWSGKERKERAATLSDPDFTGKNCPQCRMTKYNLFLHRLRGVRTRDFI